LGASGYDLTRTLSEKYQGRWQGYTVVGVMAKGFGFSATAEAMDSLALRRQSGV